MTGRISRDLAKSLSELVSIRNAESFPRYQAPFADYRRLRCVAGAGGSPAENQNRSRRLSGPGYGGHGGSIYFRATHLVGDLLHIGELVRAKDGGDAAGTSRGRHAADAIVNVPLGSILRKRVRTDGVTRRIFWHQFLQDEEAVLVARGGRGGLGPSCFKKHDHRLAEAGESVSVELELRLPNDVAFVGAPNSGKTSLVSSLTSYMTRIGPEEGSTTRPHVAVIKFRDGVHIRALDLPPLRAGFSAEAGRICRHLYRSRLIAYVLDAAEDADHFERLGALREAVARFCAPGPPKLEMVVMTKCDRLHRNVLFNLDSLHYRLLDALPELRLVATSATHGLGIERCVRTIRALLHPEELAPSRRCLVESRELRLLAPGQQTAPAPELTAALPPPRAQQAP